MITPDHLVEIEAEIPTAEEISDFEFAPKWTAEQAADVRGMAEEIRRLRAALQGCAGGDVQAVLCNTPHRRLEHLSGMCPHCRARAALKGEDFIGGPVP